MTNEELEEFELVAKACGFELTPPFVIKNVTGPGDDRFIGYMRTDTHNWWNPKTDDGDALRLAVKLHIPISFPFLDDIEKAGNTVTTWGKYEMFEEELGDNPETATRLAIWKAAVEYARSLK